MEFVPETITINNITFSTQYNDSDYLLDSQNLLLLGQLLDFQLVHICYHLELPYKNEFGFDYPRKQLIKQIIENRIFSFENCPECDKLGISELPKDNKYTYKNIGGKPKQVLELDDSYNRTKYYENNDIFDRYNEELVPIDISIDPRLIVKSAIVEKQAKISKKKTTLLANFLSKLDKTREEKALLIIKNPKNPYDTLGKIDGTQNSSYMDVILSLICYNEYLRDNLPDFVNKLKIPILTKYFKKTPEQIKNLIPIIIHFNETLYEYIRQIASGNIVKSDQIRLQTKDFHKIKGIIFSNYDNYLVNYNPIIFYIDLLKLCIANHAYFSTIEKSFISQEISEIFDDIQVQLPKEIIEGTFKSSNSADYITFKLEGKLLHAIVTGNRYRNIDDPNETLYCNICNEFRDRYDKDHDLFHKKNIIVPHDLMNSQYDILGQEIICKEGYGYKIIEKQPLFYKLSQPEILIGKLEAIEQNIGQIFHRSINHYTINNTKIIVFYINRREQRINKSTGVLEKNYYNKIRFEPSLIIPDNDGNKYILKAIISDNDLNYQLFFEYQKKWILYNSHFNVETQNDFFENIGTYQNLLNYQDNYVYKMGIMYVYQIQSK